MLFMRLLFVAVVVTVVALVIGDMYLVSILRTHCLQLVVLLRAILQMDEGQVAVVEASLGKDSDAEEIPDDTEVVIGASYEDLYRGM